MKIIITGATGFLGRYVVESINSGNHEIIAIGRNISKLETVFSDRIKLVESDYGMDSLREITKGVDIVIHLASKLMQRDTHPLRISEFFDNIQILENLLLSCNENNVSKFIQTSSISVYDNADNNPSNDEERTPNPLNIYGLSKTVCDIYASYFQKKTNLITINLRLARLYGFGERESLMFTDFINKASEKKSLTIHGKGKSSIEYIYVKDAVDVIYLCINNQNIKGTFNIGTGKLYSVYDIAEAVNSTFDNNGNIIFYKDKPDGIQGTLMNVEKSEKLLPWKAKWSLRESLQDIKKIINVQKIK